MQPEGIHPDVRVDVSEVVKAVCDSAVWVHTTRDLSFYLSLKTVYVEESRAELIRLALTDLVGLSAASPGKSVSPQKVGVQLWALGGLRGARFCLLLADDQPARSDCPGSLPSSSEMRKVTRAMAAAGGQLVFEPTVTARIWRTEFPPSPRFYPSYERPLGLANF